mgnify:FL=1
MLKSNTHYVFVVEKDDKFFAYAKTIPNSNNLLSYLGLTGLKTVNAADSKKEAKALAEFWNDCYKKNGTYMCQ